MPSLIETGAVLDGKYRVGRRIGEGGMGTVYEGENVRIERRVAIKVLHEHVASSPEFAERFEREARASARVGSEHVCDVLDLGDLPNGERYLVMEFLDGESLEDRLERCNTMTAAQLAPLAFQLLEGLGSMHQAEVIHRDLKPANIFLARPPRRGTEMVKILDFGVAKIVPRADSPSAMTSTGMMMGTPLYMSPEQARGARDVDGRTDIYAASVIFYRALTGEMPHLGVNLHELLFKIVLEDPRPIRDIVPDVDEEFAAIVTKGLARDADQRFSSAREYQQAIVDWGQAKGDPSLLFTVTLSDRPPVLQSLSGGFPAQRIAAAQTPVGMPSSGARVGPPTPQGSAGQTAMASPTAKQNSGGGTPMVWSDATPEISKRLGNLAQAKTLDSRHASAGQTQVLDGRASMTSDANLGSRPPPSNAAPPRPTGRVAVVAALAGIAVIGALAGGVWFFRQNKATPTPDVAAATASAPIVSELPTMPPAVVVPAPAADPRVPGEGAASARVTTAAPTAAPVQKATAANVPVAKPATAPSASVAASASAPPATSSTPSTPGHRKFRPTL